MQDTEHRFWQAPPSMCVSVYTSAGEDYILAYGLHLFAGIVALRATEEVSRLGTNNNRDV